MTACVQPNCAISAAPRTGSHSAITWVAAPLSKGTSTLVTKPVVWVIGDGPNWTSDSVYPKDLVRVRAPEQ